VAVDFQEAAVAEAAVAAGNKFWLVKSIFKPARFSKIVLSLILILVCNDL
jgi:hypothetical protein